MHPFSQAISNTAAATLRQSSVEANIARNVEATIAHSSLETARNGVLNWICFCRPFLIRQLRRCGRARPFRIAIGPWANSHCRVVWRGEFLMSEVPLYDCRFYRATSLIRNCTGGFEHGGRNAQAERVRDLRVQITQYLTGVLALW